MKSQKEILEIIRKAEAEIAYADPKRAGKLAERIVRLKSLVFKK